jgi:hypothetical protein
LAAPSQHRLDWPGLTSHMGRSRHFDDAPITSALPRQADILEVCRHVKKCQERKSRLLLMGPAMDHQLSDKRKPDPERRAAVIPIFCRYQPMVRLDNGARDGQPHPHAFRLAGEKRFEDLF